MKLHLHLCHFSLWFYCQTGRLSGTGKNRTAFDKYENKSQVFEYNTAADSTLPSVSKKRKHEVDEEKQSKKIKTVEEVVSPKKKKKKHSVEEGMLFYKHD